MITMTMITMTMMKMKGSSTEISLLIHPQKRGHPLKNIQKLRLFNPYVLGVFALLFVLLYA